MTQHSPRRSGVRPTAAVLLVLVLLLTGLPAITNAGAQSSENLRSYYPNIDMVRQGQYLEGFNYQFGTARSVLWFQERNGGRFRQYNWGPEDSKSKCHWDQLRWRNGTLRYQKTRDNCGSIKTEVKFSPNITLMPENWAAGTDWVRQGTSDVTFKENGTVTCRGTVDWTAEVLGWKLIDPERGAQAIHVRSTQVTTWTSGNSDFGCSAGFVTPWREDYFLMPDLAIEGGGTAPAFKRSIGGNQAGGPDRWDVWFDKWVALPG